MEDLSAVEEAVLVLVEVAEHLGDLGLALDRLLGVDDALVELLGRVLGELLLEVADKLLGGDLVVRVDLVLLGRLLLVSAELIDGVEHLLELLEGETRVNDGHDAEELLVVEGTCKKCASKIM